MPKAKVKALYPAQLRTACDLKLFDFATTKDLPELREFLGQTRALKAAQFGIGIEHDGYNIYALGPSGIGKRSILHKILEKEAREKPTPPDICYVHNFQDSQHPLVMLLPAGLGQRLKEDMRALIEVLRVNIPALFESEAYRTRIKEIQVATQKKQDEGLNLLELKAQSQGLQIIQTNQGLALGAIKDDKMLSESEFDALPKEEREEKEKLMRALHEEMALFLDEAANWHKEERQQIKKALKYFTKLEVESAIADVRKKYENVSDISNYLNEVQRAIIENPTDFRKEDAVGGIMPLGTIKPSFIPYQVNVLVDNSELVGAPVVYEDNPLFANLVGHIDQVSQFGALVTDFTLLSAGALQKANGGYLLLDALKLLSQPFAWEGLKRALKAKEVRIENIGQLMGFVVTVFLKPDPVPLKIKVIILGERYIYYLLCALDPEFPELFKVAADFDDGVPRTGNNQILFAQLLKKLADQEHLKPLSKEAVAEVVEYASRLISDSKKISTHVRLLTDLLREADHWAELAQSALIEKRHIEEAIEQQKYRASRVKDELYEHIARGVLLIDTSGQKIGQVNGLSYLELGTIAFGQPSCISARVHRGSGELIDIERAVHLGGPIHSKGVLILSGYISGYYATDISPTLSASLVFEQSYNEVDGDSASTAEACALLSAIAKIPLKQSLAITGSINQHGQVQAVGGINEKIEGFFDICNERGLTGEQGVIIPTANIDRLMLRKDLIAAAKNGKFHIYAVSTVDEAMELLTGKRAGVRNAKGKFPKGSINEMIETRLRKFAKRK